MKSGNWDFFYPSNVSESARAYMNHDNKFFFFERSGVCLESQESGEVWIIFKSETWNSRLCTHMTMKNEERIGIFEFWSESLSTAIECQPIGPCGKRLTSCSENKLFKWNHSLSDDQVLRIGIQKPDQVKHYSLSQDWGGKIKWRPTFEVSLLCKIEIKFPRRILCSSIRAMCMREITINSQTLKNGRSCREAIWFIFKSIS